MPNKVVDGRWSGANIPFSLGFGLTRLVGMLLREVVPNCDEVVGLKAGLATSGSAPPGGIALGDWSN